MYTRVRLGDIVGITKGEYDRSAWYSLLLK